MSEHFEKSFNINSLIVCIGWCAAQLKLTTFQFFKIIIRNSVDGKKILK